MWRRSLQAYDQTVAWLSRIEQSCYAGKQSRDFSYRTKSECHPQQLKEMVDRLRRHHLPIREESNG